MTQQQAKVITKWLVLATLVIWLVWDVYAAIAHGPEPTESNVIKDWAREYPQITALISFIAGHWLWPQKVKPKGPLDAT
jgi:threonine/homoserine/homoserine lactone efflux protein